MAYPSSHHPRLGSSTACGRSRCMSARSMHCRSSEGGAPETSDPEGRAAHKVDHDLNFGFIHSALVYHIVDPAMFPSLFRYNASAGPSRTPPTASPPPTAASTTATSSTPGAGASPLPSPISSALKSSASAARTQRSIERNYTGPDRATLPAQRSRSQAEKYFARVATENVAPGKWSKVLGIGGWVLGACESL